MHIGCVREEHIMFGISQNLMPFPLLAVKAIIGHQHPSQLLRSHHVGRSLRSPTELWCNMMRWKQTHAAVSALEVVPSRRAMCTRRRRWCRTSRCTTWMPPTRGRRWASRAMRYSAWAVNLVP